MDVGSFEKETLGVKNAKRVTHASQNATLHVFSGEGYATAYYGYMWADVLQQMPRSFCPSTRGYYDKELSDKLVKYLFAPRNSIDPNEAFRLFRGRCECERSLAHVGFQHSKKSLRA